MKAFIVNTQGLQAIPQTRIFADSAVSHGNVPLFLPDHYGIALSAAVLPAIRIDRLGTNIAERYARRYYSHITAAIQLRPAESLDGTTDYFRAIDHALSIGEWIEMPQQRRCTIESNHSGAIEADFDALGADSAVAALSRCITLKMGDVIVLDTTAAGSAVWTPERDTTAEVTIDGTRVIRFNFK